MLQCINTTGAGGGAICSSHCRVLRHLNMIRLLFLTFAVQAVVSIIVTDPPPTDIQYKYSYDIEDPTTGDKKTQFEVKQGNIVTGQYSVVDPDGTKRIVDYNAHPTKGFSAVVHTEPAVVQQDPPPVNNYVIPVRNPQELQRYTSGPNNAYYPSDRGNDRRPIMPYPYHAQDSQSDSAIYFTPANEISDNGLEAIHQGQYFVPSRRA